MRKSTHTPEYKSMLADLRRLRDAAGHTQRDIAARLEVSPSVVANIETGERRIDLLEFVWFLRACDADPLQAFKTALAEIGPATERGRRKTK